MTEKQRLICMASSYVALAIKALKGGEDEDSN